MPVDKTIARKKLILAGERLIATQGLNGLSLRKVNIEAGQKNTSAALYHFGDKNGLLLAIFDYRLGLANERRLELLANDSSTVRAIIEALIIPDIEVITETEGGSHHARFLAVMTNYTEFDFGDLYNRPAASSYGKLINALRKLLPKLPDEVFSMRFGLAMQQSIHAIAEHERHHFTATPLFVSQLIDSMEAMMTAPVSQQTQRELSLHGKQQA